MERKETPLRVPAVVTPSDRDGDVWCVNNDQLTVEPQPGAGAAMLPQSIIGDLLEKGELVSWGVSSKEVELWVLHTSRRLQSPEVRAFVEFVCAYYSHGSFVVLS